METSVLFVCLNFEGDMQHLSVVHFHVTPTKSVLRVPGSKGALTLTPGVTNCHRRISPINGWSTTYGFAFLKLDIIGLFESCQAGV